MKSIMPLLATRFPFTPLSLMLPPEVLASTEPFTWPAVIPPPEVVSTTGPLALWRLMVPPDVFAFTDPAILPTEMLPPAVLTSISPSISLTLMLPPLVLTFGYAAVGVPLLGGFLLAGGRRLTRATRPPTARTTALVGLAVVFAVSVPKIITAARDDRGMIRAAAEWLRAQPLEVEIVAAAKLRDAYYAGAEWHRLPRPEKPRTLKRLRNAGVRYVILDEDRFKRYPELRKATEEELRVLHRVSGPDGWAAVFELPPSKSHPPRAR